MAIDAGRYDPIRATIYSKTTTYTNREPIQTNILICTRYIRFPFAARTGSEVIVQQQMKSSGQIAIRLRRDSVTRTIDPGMEIHHDSRVYGIISINPIMDRDELEFLCQCESSVAIS